MSSSTVPCPGRATAGPLGPARPKPAAPASRLRAAFSWAVRLRPRTSMVVRLAGGGRRASGGAAAAAKSCSGLGVAISCIACSVDPARDAEALAVLGGGSGRMPVQELVERPQDQLLPREGEMRRHEPQVKMAPLVEAERDAVRIGVRGAPRPGR